MKRQNLILTFLFVALTQILSTPVKGQHKSKDSIECFELRTNLKGFFLKDSINPVETKYLYSFGELSMFCMPNYSTNVSVELVGDELITKDTLRVWTAYNYFIYKNDKTIGREYTSEIKNVSRLFNVDSFLKARKIVPLDELKKYKCIADSVLPNTDLLRTFVLKSNEIDTLNDQVYADTLYYVYKKYNRNLQFEFMIMVDTVKDYHVVKATHVLDREWNKILNGKKNWLIFREHFYELMPAPVQDYDKVYALFQQFIKDTTQ